jgi:hypothetical protein
MEARGQTIQQLLSNHIQHVPENYLLDRPTLVAHPLWNEEQDRDLETIHPEMGTKWKEIAKKFPGQDSQRTKKRYKTLLTKNANILGEMSSNSFIETNFKEVERQLCKPLNKKIN